MFGFLFFASVLAKTSDRWGTRQRSKLYLYEEVWAPWQEPPLVAPVVVLSGDVTRSSALNTSELCASSFCIVKQGCWSNSNFPVVRSSGVTKSVHSKRPNRSGEVRPGPSHPSCACDSARYRP